MDSVIYETLKKINYDNLQQFVEDINRNFAIIQNSPLYKGIPGKGGDEGKPGSEGERGSKFFFVDINKFNEQFPGEITNGSDITLDWLNIRLQSFEEKNKLLKALGTDNLVNCDIIVLTNSIMLQYILIEDILKDTGIAFNEQSNLVSSIETKIEEYVKYYVDNNTTIANIQNIFEHYTTYAKNYTSTNNTYITNAKTKSSVYIPYFAGVSDTQGIKLENHKYFGFADKEFPESNNGTIVFGSMKRYVKLIQQTLSTTQRETYTSDYAPGEGNIPSIVFLQDTDNAGLMFGRKTLSNLKRFGMIYKDKDNNLVIKSDMGNLETDFSSIILNRNFLKYNKEVWFGDNLNLSKDFIHNGNTNNKFYRTAEFIHDASDFGPTSLQEGSQEELTRASKERSKIIEVGYWDSTTNKSQAGKDAEYRNLNEIIKLKYFISNILVTDETGSISKDYIIEKSDILAADKLITDDNLNDLNWQGTAPENNSIITSNYIETLIKKINSIQHFVKENYWLKSDYSPNESPKIPALWLINDLKCRYINVTGIKTTVDTTTLDSKIINIGKDIEDSITNVLSKSFIINYLNNESFLTTDNNKKIISEYIKENYELPVLDKLINIDLNITNPEKHILTSEHLLWLNKRINNVITGIVLQAENSFSEDGNYTGDYTLLGTEILFDDINTKAYIKDNNVYDYNGFQIKGNDYKKVGSNTERPILSGNDGFCYFDTTLNKPIYKFNNNWVSSDGNLADIKYIGKFNDKPNTPKVGFKYISNDLRNTNCLISKVPIFFTGSEWINSDGIIVNNIVSLAKNTVLFAGIIDIKCLDMSLTFDFTYNDVYYSTVDKKFVVLYNEQYYSNWNNDYMWNNNKTLRPHNNLYYVSLDENKRYKYFKNLVREGFYEEEITLNNNIIPFNGILKIVKIEEIGIPNNANGLDVYWNLDKKCFVIKYLNKYYNSWGNDYIWFDIKPYTNKKYCTNNINYIFDGNDLVIE